MRQGARELLSVAVRLAAGCATAPDAPIERPAAWRARVGAAMPTPNPDLAGGGARDDGAR